MSTSYLSDHAHVWTSCVVTNGRSSRTHPTKRKLLFSSSAAAAAPTSDQEPQSASTEITISSSPSGGAPFAEFPKARAYQLRLPNRGPPLSVEANGVAVPFVRWGAVRASRQTPPSSQWYYAFEEDEGIGPVIDLVNADTSTPLVVKVAWRDDAQLVDAALDQGVYGTLIRAIYAHANQDTDRTNPDENSPGPAYVTPAAGLEAHSYEVHSYAANSYARASIPAPP